MPPLLKLRSAAPAAPPSSVDTVKARSTLVALVQPAAWIGQLASQPAQTGHALCGVAQSVLHGQFSQAGSNLGGLLGSAMHPTGIAGGIYLGGLYLQGGVDTLIGGMEIHQGLQTKDKFMTMMGSADLVGAGSSYAFALGDGGVALGLNLASNAAKTALVLLRPHDYSRIQKAKTLFDSMASVSAGLMKAGIAPVPALAGYIGFGVTQIVYMNDESFRARVDAMVDWMLQHV